MGAVKLKPNFSIEKAHKTQLKLSKQIVLEDVLPEKIRFVAGVDVAYVKDLAVGAVAVLDYASLELVESKTVLCKVRFPYVPTLLSFRETPPTVLCIKICVCSLTSFLLMPMVLHILIDVDLQAI